MPSPILTAALIRDPASSKNDDRIRVCREDNNLRVQYYDGETRKDYELLLTNTSLGTYVKHLCKLFNTDVEPFKTMQFNFIGFPTYLVNKDTLSKSVIYTLQDIAGIVVESAFADDPEDKYDDMPALVERCCKGKYTCF